MSASSSQRILCLWLRRLSTDRIARKRRAKLRDASALPLAVAGKRGNAETLVAIDGAAERRGLHIGMTLAQARAMYPALDVAQEDTDADAQLLDGIADWCLRYTPLVACDAPDGLLLDITGCTHLYHGEHELVAEQLEDLTPWLTQLAEHDNLAGDLDVTARGSAHAPTRRASAASLKG